jgi:acetolactate synthase small subunit
MKRKEFIHDTEVHAQALSDLEGCSGAYLASIKATIDDLKSTNSAITGRKAIVVELIKELTDIEKKLDKLKADNQDKIDAFLSLLDGFEVLELARTGIAGLSRGLEGISDQMN